MRRFKVKPGVSKIESIKGIMWNQLYQATDEELQAHNDSVESNNNGVFLGPYPDGWLIVMDFDRERTTPEEMQLGTDEQNSFDEFCISVMRRALGPDGSSYYAVRSGSMGLHFYFYVLNFEEHVEELSKNHIFKMLNKDYKRMYSVKGIDIMTTAFVFGEGSDFSGHEDADRFHVCRYERISPAETVPQIPYDDFLKLVETVKEYVSIISPEERETNTSAVITPDMSESITADDLEILDELPLRMAFRWILTGQIQITNEAFEHMQLRQGNVKFKIWSAFWREIMYPNPNTNISPISDLLARVQTEFDSDAQRANIHRQIGDDKKPITRGTYNSYFAPWIDAMKLSEEAEREDQRERTRDWIRILGIRVITPPHCCGYHVDLKEYFYWTGSGYELNTNAVKGICRTLVEEIGKMGHASEINELLHYIQSRAYYKSSDFDTSEEIMVMNNGLYNTMTQTLSEHDHTYLSLDKIPYNKIPNITQPGKISLDFFEGLGFSEEEMNRLFQVLKAIVEKRLYREKYFLFVWGVTNSGKTLLGEKMGFLFNPDGSRYCLLRMNKIDTTFGLQPTLGVKVAIIDDVAAETITSSQFSTTKNLTSGRSYEVEPKNGKAFTKLIDFSIYMSGNKPFSLPQGEEIGALISRCFVFYFPRSHEKNMIVMKQFLYNREDHELLLNFLLNLPAVPLESLPTIPYAQANQDISPLSYWQGYANPLEIVCRKYLRRNTLMKTNLNIATQILQAAISKGRYHVDCYSKSSYNFIRKFCHNELNATIPKAKMETDRSYISWAYGVECLGGVNEEITGLDSEYKIDIDEIDQRIENGLFGDVPVALGQSNEHFSRSDDIEIVDNSDVEEKILKLLELGPMEKSAICEVIMRNPVEIGSMLLAMKIDDKITIIGGKYHLKR